MKTTVQTATINGVPTVSAGPSTRIVYAVSILAALACLNSCQLTVGPDGSKDVTISAPAAIKIAGMILSEK